MATTYDLIGRRLAKYVQTNNPALYTQCFTPYPSDIVYTDVKVNDKSSGVNEGASMASLSSQSKNFVARGMTFDPCQLADFSAIKSIAAVKDLEAETTAGICKTSDGQLYIVVNGEVNAGTAKAVVEAAIAHTFFNAANEYSFIACEPTQGIHGTVAMDGLVVKGTAQVYKVGEDTAPVIPAANIGKLDANPAA